jgi:hypothetical protein
MNKILLHLFTFCALSLTLFWAGCDKNEPNTDDEPFVPPTVTAPSYSFSRYDANGLLMVQRTFAYYEDPFNGLIETITKEAKASFKNSPFNLTFSNAGNVVCQSKLLNLQGNASYLLNGTAGAGLTFQDTTGVRWEVAGNATTGIPMFVYTTSFPMPIYKGIGNNSIPSTISRSTGTKIPLGANVEGADSIFVTITSGTKSVKKTVGSMSTKCEFSNTELSGLPASKGITALIQVAPIKYDISLSGGMKMYFANQSSYTKYIEVK